MGNRSLLTKTAAVMILSSLLAFFWITPLRGGIELPTDSSGVTLVLRFDDVSKATNISLLDYFLDAMGGIGARTTLGVIPAVGRGDVHSPGIDRFMEIQPGDDISRKLVEWSEKGSEIALHGLHHTFWEEDSWSEFSGRPIQEQQDAISQGISILENTTNITPELFIPPWNTYDENTAKVCADHDLKISASYATQPGRTDIDYDDGDDYLVLNTNVEGIEKSIQAIRKAEHSRGDVLLVIMLHEYQINQSGIDSLQNEIRKLSEKKTTRYATISQILKEDPLQAKASVEAGSRLREATQDPRPMLMKTLLDKLGLGISIRLQRIGDILHTGDTKSIVQASTRIRTIQWGILLTATISLTTITWLALLLIKPSKSKKIHYLLIIGSILLLALAWVVLGHPHVIIELVLITATPITLYLSHGSLANSREAPKRREGL